MDLIECITRRMKFSEQDCAVINDAFKTETYAKGTLIIKPDSFSNKIFFIEKGLIRTFYYKDEKDITEFFFDEGSFTTSINSVFYGTPEPYGFEALEKTTVRAIIFKDLEALFNTIPLLQSLCFYVTIDILNLLSQKLQSIQFQTAEQRYRIMMDMYPEILLRASLGHIASYLGITQQTLSVIRAKR
jgi:CRP-like cAMP-binding protein